MLRRCHDLRMVDIFIEQPEFRKSRHSVDCRHKRVPFIASSKFYNREKKRSIDVYLFLVLKIMQYEGLQI